MTDAEKIAALIRYRLEQADEALAAATLNLANGLERSAINRAYYAMFYAVLALLTERTIETSRHSGAIAQFDLLYVKPQVFRADLSRSLHRAFLHRQAADYGAEPTLTRSEIESLTSEARTFVAEAPDYGDNAYYLYRHALLTRSRLEHVWLLKDLSHSTAITREFRALQGESRGHRLRIARRASLRGYWLYLTSRYVFHTHGVYRFVRRAFRREIVCLWHGMPIKTIGRLNRVSPNPFPTFGTRHVATSHFFRYVIASAFQVPPEQVMVCGLPRCDALLPAYRPGFGRDHIRRLLGVPEGRRLVLWMPTFRTEFTKSAKARSFLDDLEPGLLATLDRLCAEHGCFVIAKLHTYDILNNGAAPFAHDHVRLLKAREWLAHDIPLYELIATSDALISDVSSVLIDYLVTGRPIGILGFDPKTYARGLVYPVEVLLRSTRFDVLADEASIGAFLQKIGKGPVPMPANDIASMFHEDFAESGAETILTEVGIAAGERPREGASAMESAL